MIKVTAREIGGLYGVKICYSYLMQEGVNTILIPCKTKFRSGKLAAVITRAIEQYGENK
jgi:hypothetical protein